MSLLILPKYSFVMTNQFYKHHGNGQGKTKSSTYRQRSVARLGIFLIQIPTTIFEKKNKTI